jgi:hypothetical protein
MRLLAGLICLVLGGSSTALAQTKQYLSYASICGGEAELVSMSEPNNYSRCADPSMTNQGCISVTIYRYQIRCPGGQIHTGPEVYIHSKGGGGGTLRVEGNTLSAYLSHRQTAQGLQAVWDRLPAGYAPLPKEARVLTKTIAQPPPPPPQPRPAPPIVRAPDPPAPSPARTSTPTPGPGPVDKGPLFAVGIVGMVLLGGLSLFLRGQRSGSGPSWLERVAQSSSVAIAVSLVAMALGFSDEVKLASIGIGIFVLTVAVSLAT